MNHLDQVATSRMLMIMPLIEDGIDDKERIKRQKQACEKHDLSYRTLGRYRDAYLEKGFEGLKPCVNYTRKSSSLPGDFEKLLNEAIILRRECPTRSVNDIIRILELEGHVDKGKLTRSTLQRHLQKAGFSAKQLSTYQKKGTASRRFQKEHRMALLQGDIKYGPHLPIGKDKTPKQVYLAAFIDDATRFIVSAKFYDNQRTEVIEDCLREGIMAFGKPKAIYVDNGKQYRSKWLDKACSKLGIRLTFAKPYHPEGKGKIEIFNKRVDSFLSEVALNKPKTLEELNDAFRLWLDKYYHENPHSSLENKSPKTVFTMDKQGLDFVDTNLLRDAFLHTKERLVDKTGCIAFDGQKYEVGVNFIGRKVDIYYDPTWRDEVEVHYENCPPFIAKRQVVGENCGVRKNLPEDLHTLGASSSRLLDALNKDNITGRTNRESAVRYSDYMGGVDNV